MSHTAIAPQPTQLSHYARATKAASNTAQRAMRKQLLFLAMLDGAVPLQSESKIRRQKRFEQKYRSHHRHESDWQFA